MSIGVRVEGGVRILDLAGEFTIGSAGIPSATDPYGNRLQDLARVLRDLLDAGCPRIVLNLEQVRLLDSAGLGELVAWKKRALEERGDIRLVRPRARVRDVLDLTELTRIFGIFEDEKEAVASFRPG